MPRITTKPTTRALLRAAIATNAVCRARDRAYWLIDPRTRTERESRLLTEAYDADNLAKHAAMKACGVAYHGEQMLLTPENQERAARVLSMIDRLTCKALTRGKAVK